MASKKITELPLITAITSSVGYGTLDYRSVIPVVVGGSTNQITVEDFSIYAVRHSATTQSNTFLGNQTITGNISVSGTSTLTGNTSVGGTLGVTGNTNIGGNLVVAGRITAEEFHTEITTASVIYSSGSTKFGDTIDDRHEITGSTDISGSLTVRGNVLLNGTTFDISQLNAYTQSLKNEVGTIEAYTASVKETISQTLAYTASVKNEVAGIQTYTASLKGAVLPNGTNLDIFGNLRVSGSTYFGDNASDSTIITGKVEVTGSVSSTGGNTADFIQLTLTPSGVGGTGRLIWDSVTNGVSVGGNITANGFTGSLKSTNGVVSSSAQITELPSIQQATASLAAFTGSIRAELGDVESYTASLKETITQTLAYTASVKNEVAGIQSYTASVKETITQTLAYTQSLKETISQTLAYTASVKAEIGDIESYTASLKETISQTLAYTASVKSEIGDIEIYTASLKETITQTLAYTGSVKETISQTLAYTASVKNEVGGLEAYTASLKGAIVVNGTNVEVLGTLSAQQIHTTYTTSSVLYQSGSTKFGDTIDDTHQFTGSLNVTGSLLFAGSSDEQTSAYAGGVGHMMMVDTNRTDVYTELGTTDKPFKTLSAAITAANTANPTGTDPYTFVMMGCNVNENISFNGTAFNFITLATSCRTVINGTLTITNNPNLKQLIIRNLEFAQSVTITGNGTTDQMNDLSFYNTSFADTLNVTCANSLALWDVYSSAAVNLTNLNYLYVGGGQITGDVAIVANDTLTVPSNGMAPGQAIVFDLICNNLTFTKGGTASYVFQPHNTRIGLNAGSYTIPSGFTVSAQATTFRGTWTNNGALTMRNSSSDNRIIGTQPTYTGVLGGNSILVNSLTGSLLSTNGVVSSSQQIQNYNTFAVTGNSNTFSGTQTISGSVLVSGSIIPNVGAGSYTSSFSLGSSTNAWGDIWVGNGSVKFVNPSSGATASIALDANNQLSLENSSFTNGLKVTGSVIVTSDSRINGVFTLGGQNTLQSTDSPHLFRTNGGGLGISANNEGIGAQPIKIYTNGLQRIQVTGDGTTEVTGSLKATKVYGTTTSLTSDFNSGGIISYGNGSTTKYTQMGYDTGSSAGWIQALTQGSSYDNLLLNANGGRVIVGSTSSDGYGFQVYGASSINGQVKYTQVSATSGYTNETKSVPGSSVSYYLNKDTGTSNGSSYTYFNIEGLSNADGTLAHIILRVRKDATGGAINTQAYVQINGQDLIGVTTASGTGAVTIIKTFTVVYNSTLGWQIIGTVGTY
jgi:hypothetical protein